MEAVPPRRRLPRPVATAALAIVTLTLIAACSAAPHTPVWTGVTSGSPAATSAGSASASPSGSPTGTASGDATPSSAPTSGAWKTFTDPGRTLSFQLPEAWIVQSVAPDPGSRPGALRFDVKTAEGEPVATLHTGVPVAFAESCPEGERHGYTVLASEPVEVPFADIPGAIEPRFVLRAVHSRAFIASYGLTNMPTAVEGKVCQLQNRVSGPETTGGFWFADQPFVDPGSAEFGSTRTMFDTLAEVSSYASSSTEFADARRMIMSLKFTSQH
ncbi:hypothetical protein [Sinomonas mesophila]|uniref:hypothetical protein n=1 Tax=Sinomonas mesophila TaxID=1531955 RepID=UPI0009871809|nr:hypothetical protein [Sinomonas mesophila]